MRLASRRLLCCISLFVIFGQAAIADCGITERGTGLFFGDAHAYTITAPQGWVLDNISAVRQGLHMVFYPAGETWKNSPVVAYGRAQQKDDAVQTIPELVASTLADFHKNGNPGETAQQQPSLRLQNGKEVAVYFYRGDQWDNYEAVGYIEEEHTINFVVFTARGKEQFERYLPDFHALLSSYHDMFQDDLSFFDELRNQAQSDEKEPDKGRYIGDETKRMANDLATNLKVCSKAYEDEKIATFEVIFPVTAAGRLETAYLNPRNGYTSCFAGRMLEYQASPHAFESLLLYYKITMK